MIIAKAFLFFLGAVLLIICFGMWADRRRYPAPDLPTDNIEGFIVAIVAIAGALFFWLGGNTGTNQPELISGMGSVTADTAAVAEARFTGCSMCGLSSPHSPTSIWQPAGLCKYRANPIKAAPDAANAPRENGESSNKIYSLSCSAPGLIDQNNLAWFAAIGLISQGAR